MSVDKKLRGTGDYLKRLPPDAYREQAHVYWSMIGGARPDRVSVVCGGAAC